jgi:branched-subunit amino acid ABC-type transport system permease component
LPLFNFLTNPTTPSGKYSVTPMNNALGLGILNKFLEGWTGAVLAKIAVLVFIIVFIQKRPQGIFAMKGRSAEA